MGNQPYLVSCAISIILDTMYKLGSILLPLSAATLVLDTNNSILTFHQCYSVQNEII